MKSVTLFYRDGDNYKCTWTTEIDDSLVEGVELDTDFRSDCTIEIESLGLTINDIPLIKEYGFNEMDHNYVSVVKIEDVDIINNN